MSGTALAAGRAVAAAASGVTWSAVRSLVAPQFEHHGCAAITATGWTKKIARKPASTCAGRKLAAKSPICVMADSALGRTVDCGARCRAIRARPGPPPHPAAAGGGLGIGLPHRDSQPPSLARRGAAQLGAYVVLDSTTQLYEEDRGEAGLDELRRDVPVDRDDAPLLPLAERKRLRSRRATANRSAQTRVRSRSWTGCGPRRRRS